MFQKPLVKSAFHLSWFLLILGGTSLFEKKLWGVAGGAMLLYGLIVLAYTAFAIYLHKPFLKQPATVLLITLGFVLLLIIAHITFEHYVVSMILAALAVPVLAGWFAVRRGTGTSKPTAKRKR